MGAALAYETALRSPGRVAALHASSCRAPHLRLTLPPSASPSLDGLSALDADLALFNAYRPAAVNPIATPIVAYRGEDETLPLEHVQAWSTLTTGGFRMATFPGGHFWLQQHARALGESLS
jgi:surfactin synthase thioesterase subunit